MSEVTFSIHDYNKHWVVEVKVDGEARFFRLFRDEFSAYKFIHQHRDQ